MNNNNTFHGSDLEKISKLYNIPQTNIINFAANVNPLGISDTLKKGLAANLDIMSQYPDRDYVKLRHIISNYCGADIEHIIVGNGSTELISLLISNIKAKKALLLGPTYSEYEKELDLVGCSLEEFRLTASNNFKLDETLLFETLSNGFDFLILCNPNNPTGSALTTSQLDSLLKYCDSNNIFVMIDETYIEFASEINHYSAIPLCREYENLMVLRGISKFFAAPGLRMGYGITSNTSLLSYLKKHQNPWSLNSIAEFAGELLFTDTEYIETTRTLISKEREKCYRYFENTKEYKVFPTQANFILVQLLNPSHTANGVFERCIREGLMIRNCNSFFHGDGEFIRFCLMNPADNDKLLDCIRI
ncbi:MAG: aminotransferase class I/II-fold pyridoxal phosphate-dependent enzyme [Eubacteriales bacterium]